PLLNIYVATFTDTATADIYTLSLHDALPISGCSNSDPGGSGDGSEGGDNKDDDSDDDADPADDDEGEAGDATSGGDSGDDSDPSDRKSTRLNSSHVKISYAVFCLKKKRKTKA